MAAAEFWISGRVQGVFYRASARAEALELGLSGYARNLPDGRVHVHAEGEPAALDALHTWLCHGPPAAEVRSVVRELAGQTGIADFSIG